jgi:hypothetical protein
VIKSVVSNVHVDTFLESRDVTFFENIFPMKNSYDMFSLPANVIVDTTPQPSKFFDYADFTVHLMDDTPKTIADAFALENLKILGFKIEWELGAIMVPHAKF